MALSLSLTCSQSCDCVTVTLTDNTGAYSASNTGGWGSPNLDYTDITCAFFTIVYQGTTYYKDITSIFTNATALTDLVFTIVATDVDGESGAKLTDGNIVVTYYVGDTPGTWDGTSDCGSPTTSASAEINVPVYCQVQCCVFNKVVAIPQYYCCDECHNQYVDRVFDMWLMLKALQVANTTTGATQFTNTLGQLQNLCNNKDCTCV